jgi:hypothetical protein
LGLLSSDLVQDDRGVDPALGACSLERTASATTEVDSVLVEHPDRERT